MPFGNTISTVVAAIVLALSVPMPAVSQAGGQQPIRVGGSAQQVNLVSQQRPVYPPEAKAARIQGLVQLQILIGKDGTVQNLTVLTGPEELRQSAVDAVKQWAYKPTLLNGQPVEVITTVDVNYTLAP
jgi:protein TonB